MAMNLIVTTVLPKLSEDADAGTRDERSFAWFALLSKQNESRGKKQAQASPLLLTSLQLWCMAKRRIMIASFGRHEWFMIRPR